VRRFDNCFSFFRLAAFGHNPRVENLAQNRTQVESVAWCPGRESYATTDTTSRCLSLVWWRECLARWRRFATSRSPLSRCGGRQHPIFAMESVVPRRRIALATTRFADATCGTIRLKLFKIGAQVRISVRRMASPFPTPMSFEQPGPRSTARLSEPSAHRRDIELMTMNDSNRRSGR
jgi:hypothetical protein